MKKLLCVDGNSLINRAFYGVKPLTTRDGKNTNAVYGFINMLKNHLDTVKPDYAVAAFDLKKPTFRNEAYDFYKATRKGMPQELAEQVEDAKSAAQSLGFKLVSVPCFEADDILGSFSAMANDDIQVYLLTGDRDSYQLVGENVNVLYLSTKETKTIDLAAIDEMYGLEPKALIEVKALMGDTSDNIPGVKGIGEKTAVSLIKEYGSIQKLYEAVDDKSIKVSKGVLEKLVQDKEMAFASRFLAEIKKDVPLGLALCDVEYNGIDCPSLLELCESLELESVISRLKLREQTAEQIEMTFDVEYTGIQDHKEIKAKKITCHFDTEQGNIYTKAEGKTYKCPVSLENLKDIFCDEEKEVLLYDVKSKLLLMKEYGGEINIKCSFYDVMLASYVADPGSVISEDGLFGAYGTGGIDSTDRDAVALTVVNNLERLKGELEEKIRTACQEKLLYEVEFPLAVVLAKMEDVGFLVDREGLLKYGAELDGDIEKRQAEIYVLAGKKFNINSPKQLGEVLFEHMGLPVVKKTKSGYSTDAETLEKLREHSPIIEKILEYRTVSKLKSTYIEGLCREIGEDGRLHTSFKQALTQTGRLSSAEPNLQNIPIRTPEGRQIRKVFIPEKGKVLIDADYSQIELRLMAQMSGDENMCRAYMTGEDIHTLTASRVFGVDTAEVTGEMRKKAKAVNFGIIYGISDFSLAGDIKVTKKEAARYIESYFEKYPGVKGYLEEVKAKAYEDGFVTTLFGRRRYIPELKSRIYMQRMFGERVAMNAPIQGTAADIIKIAMINVDRALEKEGIDGRLILQVHDELILECSQQHAQRAKELLVREMTNSVKFDVPLEVSAEVGDNWDSCHS